MRKKFRVLSVILLYSIFILMYLLFFLLRIGSTPLFLFLTVGSVAVLSTSTIYTVIQSKGSQDGSIRKKKFITKKMAPKKKIEDIFEDYIDAMPSIEEYVESNGFYEDMEVINKYIFSIFSKDEIYKINLLGLSKIDKILFIREMLYFSHEERSNLIESMLKNQEKNDEKITYTSPMTTIEMEDQIRVYIRSLIESGEKTKIIIIDTTDFISTIKERIGILFDYELEDFLISSGGLILEGSSDLLVKDFDIADDDIIALIPHRL